MKTSSKHQNKENMSCNLRMVETLDRANGGNPNQEKQGLCSLIITDQTSKKQWEVFVRLADIERRALNELAIISIEKLESQILMPKIELVRG